MPVAWEEGNALSPSGLNSRQALPFLAKLAMIAACRRLMYVYVVGMPKDSRARRASRDLYWTCLDLLADGR